mgnify:CR=1 FL=1
MMPSPKVEQSMSIPVVLYIISSTIPGVSDPNLNRTRDSHDKFNVGSLWLNIWMDFRANTNGLS